MGKGVHDFIKAHLSKLKKKTHPNDGTAGTNCLFLASCNHPRTPSFAVGRRRQEKDKNVGAPVESGDGVIRSINADEVQLSALSGSGSSTSGPSDGERVAVVTFSKDPYEEFRQSILEMVEARRTDDDNPSQPLDWDFMEDLLVCYLELNDRTVHKYILGAFTDLTVTLSQQPDQRKRMTIT